MPLELALLGDDTRSLVVMLTWILLSCKGKWLMEILTLNYSNDKESALWNKREQSTWVLGTHDFNPSTWETRWEELLHDFKGILGYIAKLYLKQRKQQQQNETIGEIAQWISTCQLSVKTGVQIPRPI